MPKTKQDDPVAGQIEPSFTWETRIPHTVVLMLKSTEEDLILKACQSLYKFAHDGDLNQTLLIQYDILALLLDHLENPNRNVRRMSAMTLSELSGNNTVQSALVSAENVVRLVRVLRQDDDCVVDEVASSALLRLASDAAGRSMLLSCAAVDALVKRLTSRDPDVLKNCLDTLLVLLDSPVAVESFVDSRGVPNALELLASEYPVLQTLALAALRKAMHSADGRARVREVGGLEKLLSLLESAALEDLHSSAVAVLDAAIADPENIFAIHETGGLQKILTFVQTTTVSDVLEQCAFLHAKMAAHADVRDIFHELSAEPVMVTSLLATGLSGSQNGAARAIGHMCRKLESQEELVRLGSVSILLGMVSSPETFQSAVVALAAATRNHQLACRQICLGDHLERLVDRLGIQDEETVSHVAMVLRNMSEQETVRPVVAAGSAPTRLVACLSEESPVVLVSVCDALTVLCLNQDARTRVVRRGAADLFMDLLQHDDADVRDACVRAIQVVGCDFRCAEELCAGGAIGSLRRLRATETLRIVLEVNLSALFAVFGRLRTHHKLYDLFFDCGRQETCDSVPELITLHEQPMSHTRIVFLLNSGVCPYRGEDQPPPPPHGWKPDQGNSKRDQKESSQSKSKEGDAAAEKGNGDVDEKEQKLKGRDNSEKSGEKKQESAASDASPRASGKDHSSGQTSSSGPSSLPAAATAAPSDRPAPAQPSLPVPGFVPHDPEAAPVPTSSWPPVDYHLAGYVEHALTVIRPLATDREQSSALARLVAARMGGSVPREQLGTWSDEFHLCQLKRRAGGNVVFVGDVERAGMRCRALLFKFLADQIGLPCSLHRGAGGRHWNTVLLRGERETAMLGPYLDTVVDVMHEPGRLLPADSADAVEYTRGFESH
ncbi:armadillo repeat-containing protein 3-like [Amphibalanus amphitrite]|uniref:armadillo repeat-containing protein 3-like n=1 Tax=Amphibalanus amphitrite TaxID=1232801 RepID=UPI001C924A08|nr:armadillo repeat-containing protein 3-like [Amphibalanus amphitrite]